MLHAILKRKPDILPPPTTPATAPAKPLNATLTVRPLPPPKRNATAASTLARNATASTRALLAVAADGTEAAATAAGQPPRSPSPSPGGKRAAQPLVCDGPAQSVWRECGNRKGYAPVVTNETVEQVGALAWVDG